MTDKQASNQTAPLSLDALKRLASKPSTIILFKYDRQGRRAPAVEEGTVLFSNPKGVDVVWLEGHSSRNDFVPWADILAVHDKGAPEHTLDVFTGRGHLTQAGLDWPKD